MIVAWLRRRRFAIAALALYAALAVAVMAPLAPPDIPFTGAQDLCNHISGIIEARNALAEGQFPIRVGPNQIGGTRYPIFQFYGNLPYTLGGGVYLTTGASPYTIWKFEVTTFLVFGAFCTFCCARRLTRQAIPSLAAGAVFMTAPYVLTDIHGRVAFTELISFMLLPALLYLTWRSFVTCRIGTILASGVAWSALALSHNITYVFAALYFGLFYLSWLAPRRKAIVRCAGVGVGFALGVLLTAWTIVPQQQLLPYLCGGLLGNVAGSAYLTPLGVLLAPAVALPVHSPATIIDSPPHFGLQVGWPILAAVGIAVCCLRLPSVFMHGRRPLLARLLLLFALSFVMIWTPFDFWSSLPTMFSYVQYSYRLLMFVVLWGSLLAAYALSLGWQGRMKPIHLGGFMLVLGWTAGPFMAPHRAEPNLSVEKEIAKPDMGRGGATTIYNMAGSHLAQSTLVHRDMDWAAEGLLEYSEFNRHGRVRAVFPAIQAGDVLYLEGKLAAEVTTSVLLKIEIDGSHWTTRELPPGPFHLSLPLPQTLDKSRVHVTVEGAPLSLPHPMPDAKPVKKPSYSLAKFALQCTSTEPGPQRLLTAAVVQPTMKHGHPTRLRIQTGEPTLVQLPVLYYPGMLEVWKDGQHVETTHLGRFVAVELSPGVHAISVKFVGVRWANIVSSVTWIAVCFIAIALLLRNLHRRWHLTPDKRGLFETLLTRRWLGRLRRLNTAKQNEVHA